MKITIGDETTSKDIAIIYFYFLLIHERETRNEGVLELYGILLAVMC